MMNMFILTGYAMESMSQNVMTIAYIDPSVTTYLIQAVAGVIIAVGAVAGIYWRKAKRKVQDKLGIDGNAKKEVEDEIIEFAEDSRQ